MSAVIQGTPEWLELRKKCVGASDMPIIMGDSPWATPLKLWKQKTDLLPSNLITPSMQRGLDLEPFLRGEFYGMTGLLMLPEVIFHPEYPWLMASLDGTGYDQEKLVSILEIKCASKEDHEIAKQGKAPKKYYAQLQMQLAVTNLKMAYYFSFDGKEGVIVEVKRDDIYIERLIEKAIDFKRCMDQFIPPEMTEKERRHEECCLVEDMEAERIAERYIELGNMIENLTKQRENFKEKLIALSGGSDLKMGNMKLSKVTTKGRVDYDTILKQHNIDVDLEQFRRPNIESWRVTRNE